MIIELEAPVDVATLMREQGRSGHRAPAGRCCRPRAPGDTGSASSTPGRGPSPSTNLWLRAIPMADGAAHAGACARAADRDGVPAQTWLSLAATRWGPGGSSTARAAAGASASWSASGTIRRATRTRSTPNCSRWRRERAGTTVQGKMVQRAEVPPIPDGRPRAHGSHLQAHRFAGGAPVRPALRASPSGRGRSLLLGGRGPRHRTRRRCGRDLRGMPPITPWICMRPRPCRLLAQVRRLADHCPC